MRQIRNEKNLTLIEVAESSDMTLSVYHRIEMGQREVSDKEFKNIAKALGITPEELRDEIKSLDEKGMLEEIIQRNDAKYKLLSNPRGAIASFGASSPDGMKISVYGTAGRDGDVIINFEEEVKKFSVRRRYTTRKTLMQLICAHAAWVRCCRRARFCSLIRRKLSA